MKQMFVVFFEVCTIIFSIGFAQHNRFLLKDIQTDVQNPLGIITVKKTEKDISPFNYIIRTRDQLLFCDKNYKRLSVKDVIPDDKTKMILSKDCRYVLTQEILSLPEKEIGNGEKKYTLFDYMGNQYWSKKVTILWDEIDNSEMIISDFNGYLFVLDKKNACLQIIDNNGSERTVQLFENVDILPMREGCIDISKDGRNIVILINKYYAENGRTITKIPLRGPEIGKENTRYIPKKNGEPTIFLFNETGELQAKTIEDQESAAKIIISADGKYIICTLRNLDQSREEEGYWLTKVYNNKFSLKGTLLLYPTDILFNNSEIIAGYRQVGTNKYLLSAFDIETLTKRWTTELFILPSVISNFAIDNDSLIKIVTQTTPTRDKQNSVLNIQFINFNGAIIDSLKSSEIITSITSDTRSGKLLLNSDEFFTKNNLIKIDKAD